MAHISFKDGQSDRAKTLVALAQAEKESLSGCAGPDPVKEAIRQSYEAGTLGKSSPKPKKSSARVELVLGWILLAGISLVWHPMLWAVAFGMLFYTVRAAVSAGVTEANASAQKLDAR